MKDADDLGMETGSGRGSRVLECPTALDGEALAGYLTGRLSDEEAEAFEEHFFSCEDCWALVHSAAAARSSFVEQEGPPAYASGVVSAGPEVRRPLRPRWSILLPAAALAAAVAGVALFGLPDPEPRAPGEVFRGAEQTMSLEAELEGRVLTARWSPVPGAVGYELRGYDDEGRLIVAAEGEETAQAVDLEAAGLVGAAGVVSIDVVALDGFGQAMRRSARVTLRE